MRIGYKKREDGGAGSENLPKKCDLIFEQPLKFKGLLERAYWIQNSIGYAILYYFSSLCKKIWSNFEELLPFLRYFLLLFLSALGALLKLVTSKF